MGENSPSLEQFCQAGKTLGFKVGDVVGDGGFGAVRLAYPLTDQARSMVAGLELANESVAGNPDEGSMTPIVIKGMLLDGSKGTLDRNRKQAQREVEFSMAANHPNLVRCFTHIFLDDEGNPTSWESASCAFLVLERLNNILRHSSFCDHLLSKDKLSFSASKVGNSMADIVDGLVYMHGQHRIHRDISPKNIMLSFDGRVKLVDFGFNRPDDPKPSQLAGTPGFTAPEVSAQAMPKPFEQFIKPYPDGQNREVLTTKVDVFSLGQVFKEVFQYTAEGVSGNPLCNQDTNPLGLLSFIIHAATRRCPQERISSTEMKFLVDIYRMITQGESFLQEYLKLNMSLTSNQGLRLDAFQHRLRARLKEFRLERFPLEEDQDARRSPGETALPSINKIIRTLEKLAGHKAGLHVVEVLDFVSLRPFTVVLHPMQAGDDSTTLDTLSSCLSEQWGLSFSKLRALVALSQNMGPNNAIEKEEQLSLMSGNSNARIPDICFTRGKDVRLVILHENDADVRSRALPLDADGMCLFIRSLLSCLDGKDLACKTICDMFNAVSEFMEFAQDHEKARFAEFDTEWRTLLSDSGKVWQMQRRYPDRFERAYEMKTPGLHERFNPVVESVFAENRAFHDALKMEPLRGMAGLVGHLDNFASIYHGWLAGHGRQSASIHPSDFALLSSSTSFLPSKTGADVASAVGVDGAQNPTQAKVLMVRQHGNMSPGDDLLPSSSAIDLIEADGAVLQSSQDGFTNDDAQSPSSVVLNLDKNSALAPAAKIIPTSTDGIGNSESSTAAPTGASDSVLDPAWLRQVRLLEEDYRRLDVDVQTKERALKDSRDMCTYLRSENDKLKAAQQQQAEREGEIRTQVEELRNTVYRLEARTQASEHMASLPPTAQAYYNDTMKVLEEKAELERKHALELNELRGETERLRREIRDLHLQLTRSGVNRVSKGETNATAAGVVNTTGQQNGDDGDDTNAVTMTTSLQ